MSQNDTLKKAVLRNILDVKNKLSLKEYKELEAEAKQSGQIQIMKNIEIEQELSESFYISIQRVCRTSIIFLIFLNLLFQLNTMFGKDVSSRNLTINVIYTLNSFVCIGFIALSYKSKYFTILIYLALILT